MNLNHSQLPSYQPFETPVESHGKQYLGYVGLFGSDSGYPIGDQHYISLVDVHQQTIHFELSEDEYDDIKAEQSALKLQQSEIAYLWIEEDAHQTIRRWRLFKTTLTFSELWRLYQACYHFESLFQLIELIESLSVIPLRMFGRQLLKETELMARFVSLPASKRHHHSYPGGLLAHSLECVYLSRQSLMLIHDMSVSEKEVTLMAALLHDIGKTQTLTNNEPTSLGRLLSHEQLTLSVLSQPFKWLQHVWPQGSETLQYLLTWKANQGFCRYVGGNVMKLADHISTSASIRRMAFADKPENYHFSQLQIGNATQYVNRLN